MNTEKILTVALDMAENMLKCNAEINRVEDTFTRICKSYGIVKVDIFAIKTFITATIRDAKGISFTQNRRIYFSDMNLAKLEELNSLSRHLCQYTPNATDAEKMLNNFTLTDTSKTMKTLLGGVLGSVGFCIYFGGNFRDALAVGLIAIIFFIISKNLKNLFVNPIIFTGVISFIIGYLAILSVNVGIGVNVDKIIIGDVMLVIPGMAMVTSFRDMMCGDILAGTFRLVETALITVSITFGFVCALYLGGVM
ncbi:MAG: threonine/serine ThrE exporter family protein [Sarcina sp.]